MNTITVYNKNGSVFDIFDLPEKVIPIKNRRVSKAVNSKYFYKGTGIEYNGHNSVNISEDEYIIKGTEKRCEYSGEWVVNKNFENKFGIFKQKFQPYFSDYIGGCGPKEKKIIYNSSHMSFSGVEYIDSFPLCDNHTIYKVIYRKEQNKNLTETELCNLFQKILDSDWCTAYDKKILNDIDLDGFVHDPADWFESQNFVNTFGTIYAFVYHLFQSRPEMLKKVLTKYGLDKLRLDCSLFTIPLFVVFIIGYHNRKLIKDNLGDLCKRKFSKEVYDNLVTNYITAGIRCCDLEEKYHGPFHYGN